MDQFVKQQNIKLHHTHTPYALGSDDGVSGVASSYISPLITQVILTEIAVRYVFCTDNWMTKKGERKKNQDFAGKAELSEIISLTMP